MARRVRRIDCGSLDRIKHMDTVRSRDNTGRLLMNSLRLLISMLRMLPISIIFIRIMHGLPPVEGDWCDLDTGYTTITDGRGYPHSVFISVTRDGSVWIRAGVDHESADWTYQSETKFKVKVQVLGNDVTSMLKSLTYTDYCVLSDMDMAVNVEGGWHPSYLVLYNPETKTENVAAFNKKAALSDCDMQTNISLSPDKQGVVCNGGHENVCGMRHLPEKGHTTPTMFINNLQFDPRGADHEVECEGKEQKNYYTLKGSYYHIYIKVATCPSPFDSRMFGHAATLRAHTDKINRTIIIPDPSQTVLRDGVIQGWQVFAKVVSIEHGIYLQVWRPMLNRENAFSLIGQSFYQPEELRFQTLSLQPKEYIHVKTGDVLGIYFPSYNPFAWSSVPCSSDKQHYRYLRNPSNIVLQQRQFFHTAPNGEDACRHYSLTASLANKTRSKLLEDWRCPTARFSTGARRHSETGSDVSPSDSETVDGSSGTVNDIGSKDSDNIFTKGSSTLLHLILIIIGCLFILLMVVGFISYYRAVKS